MILDLLFPPRCPVCDDLLEPEQIGRTHLHEVCYKKLYPVSDPVCVHCGRPVEGNEEYCYDCGRRNRFDGFLQGKALFLYRGSIQKTMYRFKYASFFANYAAEIYGEWIQNKGIEVIVPVPMYGPKKRKRGYNQAESFGKALSKSTQIPMDVKLVKRIRDTAPQKALNDLQRQKNLKDAFVCNPNGSGYKRVLVVDDIYTTGTTADSIADCLYQGGVEEVYFLSICIAAGNFSPVN